MRAPHARKVEPTWLEGLRLLFSPAGFLLVLFLIALVVGLDAGVVAFGGAAA
jgi:hypothetical protein